MLLKNDDVRIDPRMRRTRQMLQQALMELMQVKSFQSITVQDIASHATVNRATFYDHFVDKYALLEFTIRDMFDRMVRSKLPEDTHLSLDALRTLTVTMCEFMAEGHSHCIPSDEKLLWQIESQITAQLVEVLRRWLEEAHIEDARGDSSVAMTASVIGWAIYGAARHWHDQKRRPPAATFAGELLPILTASLHDAYRVEGD